MKPPYHEEQSQRLRVRLLVLAAFVMLGSLAFMLFRMQVRESALYEGSLSRQSIRRVRLPAPRGRILDRRGRVLAANRPVYQLVLYLEEFRQPGVWDNTVRVVMETLDDLSLALNEPSPLDEAGVRAHIYRRLPVPLVAWPDLNGEQMARFAERRRDFAGADIQVASLRQYPYTPSACHVLGYVGRSDPALEDQGETSAFYMPEFEGKSGLERQYDRELRGKAGGRLIRVDAVGYHWDDLSELPAVPGSDIHGTLDIEIQRLAEDSLASDMGAVVILDPRNGDVLALASSPGYDHTLFVPGILRTDWDVLRDDSRAPLLNRAVSGRYPPGSIIKPLVAIAALANDLVDADTVIDCSGSYTVGPISVRCWNRRGHGPLNVRRALKQSCNPFFIDIALRGGYDMIRYQALAVGMGRRTGIDLPFESPGLLPDDAWKRRTKGDGWRAGDTANVSIGQGDLLVTPLQMAVMTAALANGGQVWQPRLIRGIWDSDTSSMQSLPPKRLREIPWHPYALEVIRSGMYDVVQEPAGTGRSAFVRGLEIAGKTGTAEVGLKHHDRKHAWMIAYAPFDSPRYAVAIIVEDAGGGGGVVVGPRIKRIMTHLTGMEGI